MEKLTLEYIKSIDVNSYDNPVIGLLRKYKPRFREYNNYLGDIYDLIKERKNSGKQFKNLKLQLKKDYYKEFVYLLDEITDFQMELLDKIIIWRKIFRVFPYRTPDVDSDMVMNVYPRYDLAGIIGMGYVTRGIELPEIRINLIQASYTREECEKLIRQYIDTIKKFKSFKILKERAHKLMQENEKILELAKGSNKRFFNEVYEDFNFGFHWIAMFL